MTKEFILKAMAENYEEGAVYIWDHLDKEACQEGANEIKRGREFVSEIREALNSSFAVLYIDGEDSILPCYPASIECDQDELDSFSEQIYNDAVALGLGVGCLVWAEFVRVPPQVGDEGRIEFQGYWEYKSINTTLTNILFKEKNDGRDC